ncbi:MAG TPA: energy transducer TonB [Candidatus Ozemobacteraceae bacterium]|nr:energy transducer TonB [Candidatus Ozemobacteraceae bacterium]HQG27299.1 energy transducer TonB [Candidatus Ozemobacteraceae bacterium]
MPNADIQTLTIDPNEGTEEYKVSILLHLALLLFMTAWMAWRGMFGPALPVVHQVRLVGPLIVAQPGSGKTPLPTPASALRSGTNKKLSTGLTGPRRPSAQSRKKHSPVLKGPVTTKTKTKVGERLKPGKADPVQASDVKPTVVQEGPEHSRELRPTLKNPSFDEVSVFSPDLSAPSPVAPPIAGLDLGDPIDTPEPAEELSGPLESGQGNEKSSPSGNPDVSAVPGGGDVSIAGIESLGGGGERLEPPRVISRVVPEYPDWARRQGVHGQAVYKVLIQEAGTVGDVITLSSTIDPRLAIVGSQSLRRWRFTPVLLNGEPRETWVQITVQFTLNG